MFTHLPVDTQGDIGITMCTVDLGTNKNLSHPSEVALGDTAPCFNFEPMWTKHWLKFGRKEEPSVRIMLDLTLAGPSSGIV